ncbi:transglycosylase SLT domain-containing protein [Mariprofundus sp. NF]|uniref:transglycosylase SLT domain-containing protein n=1 Tax=Mariprofundus sp. NF TaxID=2608716 RepID=UPI0015A4EE5B|nr:transglycosylase SLT domain-containing protein [Mariprofundus sp. NF]NWF37582.1 transglycosylase SLT domain-containing protein [Mariprofundus sp. NF]
MRLNGLIIIVSLLCASFAQAATPTLNRSTFEEARAALNSNDLPTYQTLKARIPDYPLTPYLDIWEARKALAKGSDSTVQDVVEHFSDIPESINLRVAWLHHLAKKGDWKKIGQQLEKFPADRKRTPEIAMLAAWKDGNTKQALTLFSKRWIKAQKVSGYTHPLYQQWQRSGHPTLYERWLRIDHYANSGKWKKIKGEKRHLPKDQQSLISYWQKMQNNPEKMLQQFPSNISPFTAELILNDGVKRLARSDPAKAWLQILSLAETANLNPLFLADQQRQIALRAARRHMPEAITWLNSLPASAQNEDTRSWLTRLYIVNQQWPQTIAAIDAMPDNERQQSNWLYWKARALELTGRIDLAEPLYLMLADDRGYYSFLASERLGIPLKLENSNIDAPDSATAEIAEMKAVHRAYEWLQLGNNNKASREWHFALQDASKEQWAAATNLANHWGWFDQTIRSAFKSDSLDALESRFPLGFEEEVRSASIESGLTSSEIWSIIRQESAFNSQAVSYVGAKGLMQLMPRTARAVAKQLKLRSRHPDLFSPEVNIRLGSTYLADMKQRFGSLALAAAAYNAGPHRVSSWLERTPFSAPEAWVEAIPFNETRRYVQQVMAFVTVYEWRQEKTPGSMIARIGGELEKVSLNRSH